MPWCPGCSTEYNPRRKKCPECGQSLAKGPGLNEAFRLTNRDWFTIRAVDDEMQAEIVREFLESRGYDVAVRNLNGKPKRGKPNGAQEPGCVHVMVPAELAPKAAHLLRANRNWAPDGLHGGLEDSGVVEEDYYFDEDEHEFLESNGLRHCREDDDEMY